MDDLEPTDYVILSLLNSGVNTFNGIFKKIPKTSDFKMDKRIKSLIKRGYIQKSKKDGFLSRYFNPTISLTDLGKESVENKTTEMRQEWDKLWLLYEKKDKQGLLDGMNLGMMPLFLVMGITNGMMMGSMMSLADTNYQQYTADLDYAYVDGYGDGFADGSDFGGAEYSDANFDGGFKAGF